MADTARNGSRSIGAAVMQGPRQQQQQPSRLQRRRPASLQISPAYAGSSCWNVAIPLLSPLDASPTAGQMKLRREEIPPPPQRNQEVEKPLVFKKWQHPAAPFCCESAPIAPSFFMPA
uniref:Uncharacterized protein n=1 Tax=Rhizophora mucronata TaxID=61149 RepID=A0A2P2J2Q0_RHIMU